MQKKRENDYADSIRVMATCALLGEAVGKAVSIAVKNDITPHDVYLRELTMLQNLLVNEDCFLPSKTREISKHCQNAELNISNDIIRNGQDRAHRIYNTDEKNCSYIAKENEQISYSFEKEKISDVHIVFCSDLNRDTLPGSVCERMHMMRANQRLDSPQMCMPKTLCKEFKLIGELNGEKYELLHISNNRKRAYHLTVERSLDKLTLVPMKSWGDEKNIPIISFDFR